jgi:hypothetical protein
VARAVELTAGQPWLVNALANEIVAEMAVPAAEPVTPAHVEEAKERLILARATHLDALAARLTEPRVRRVIEPVLAGAAASFASDDDVRYVRDLGLVASAQPLRTANPIYHDAGSRALAKRWHGCSSRGCSATASRRTHRRPARVRPARRPVRRFIGCPM